MQTRNILLVAAIFLLLGCSAIISDRKVENNTFFSAADPKVQIQVSPQLKYLGKVSTSRHHQTVSGSRGLLVTSSSYLFADIGKDNLVKRGVIIRADRISKGIWEEDLFLEVKNRLVSDYQEIEGQRWEHFIAVRSDIFTEDEMSFVSSEGLRGTRTTMKEGRQTITGWHLPRCFLVEAFGMRAGNSLDTRMCLYYFEDIALVGEGSSCKDWIAGGVTPQDKERSRVAIMDSRGKALTFIKKKR